MARDRCCIFGAGEHFSLTGFQREFSCVIAADGGYRYLIQKGIQPDYIIGDFDSLHETPGGANVIALSVDKDETDMAAAITLGLKHGFSQFYLYGGTGGRLDHTLANLQCLAGLAQRGHQGFLFGQDVVITAIHNRSLRFQAGCQGTVSVFAHSEKVWGVYEDGLKFSLTDAVLGNTYPLGVSNAFTGKAATISAGDGTLQVFMPLNAFDYLCKDG